MSQLIIFSKPPLPFFIQEAMLVLVHSVQPVSYPGVCLVTVTILWAWFGVTRA